MAKAAAEKSAYGSICGKFAVASPKIPADNVRVGGCDPIAANRCASPQGSESKRMQPLAAITVRDLLHKSAGTWIGLAFAIAILVWIVVRVRAAYRSDDDPDEDADQMLSEIQEMYEEGKLSEEEFRSIKGRLTRGQDTTSATRESS